MPSEVSRETSLPLFADDSKCFRVVLGHDDGDSLQEDLSNLFDWFCTWGVEFTVSKCKVLRVTCIKSVIERDYFVRGTKLERMNVEKELGVLISHDLSWKNHVDFIASKAQRMLTYFIEHVVITEIKTKKLSYVAWVRSRLDYASIVWSPHP